MAPQNSSSTMSKSDLSDSPATPALNTELGSMNDNNEEKENPVALPAGEEEDNKVYPPAKKTALVMTALYLALFLVSLDRTIIATAIPHITDVFHSVDDIGWYNSAYLMTGCAFQLLYGRIYTFYSPKWVFLSSVAIFEIGSLLSGVANSSPMFIAGRAFSGLGSAGIFSGTIVLTVNIIPLRKRPMYQGLMGATALISSVIAPLIGGAFTTNLTWRWCFYINLPIGGATMILVIIFFQEYNDSAEEEVMRSLPLRQKLDKLDPIGTVCLLPGIVCLLLALQWGGLTYAWSDGQIIALLVIFGLLMIAFCAVQVWKNENATLPPRILKYRSVSSTAFFSLCTSGSMMVLISYLPLWFQAIQGVSAMESGIRILPVIIALIVASIVAGGTITVIGYYTPFLIACSAIMSVGAGLLTTFKVETKSAIWIGYQVILGFGIGFGQQQAGLAAQVVLPSADVPTGVSFKFFTQQLGGAVFVSVGQTVLNSKLVSGLKDLPDFDPKAIANMGAVQLRNYVGPQYLDEVLIAYNHALVCVFQVGLVLACISMIGAMLTEWKSVKGKERKIA